MCDADYEEAWIGWRRASRGGTGGFRWARVPRSMVPHVGGWEQRQGVEPVKPVSQGALLYVAPDYSVLHCGLPLTLPTLNFPMCCAASYCMEPACAHTRQQPGPAFPSTRTSPCAAQTATFAAHFPTTFITEEVYGRCVFCGSFDGGISFTTSRYIQGGRGGTGGVGAIYL